jgi:hypothetical protein
MLGCKEGECQRDGRYKIQASWTQRAVSGWRATNEASWKEKENCKKKARASWVQRAVSGWWATDEASWRASTYIRSLGARVRAGAVGVSGCKSGMSHQPSNPGPEFDSLELQVRPTRWHLLSGGSVPRGFAGQAEVHIGEKGTMNELVVRQTLAATAPEGTGVAYHGVPGKFWKCCRHWRWGTEDPKASRLWYRIDLQYFIYIIYSIYFNY